MVKEYRLSKEHSSNVTDSRNTDILCDKLLLVSLCPHTNRTRNPTVRGRRLFQVPDQPSQIVFNFATPCILVVDHFFVFQPKAHNVLNTCIYHLIHPACFGIYYTIIRENIPLFVQELSVYCNFVTYIKYRVIKSLCAPDDYNTESYKKSSKCPPPVSRHLLTRRTMFSKTVFNTARSTFRMFSVMVIFNPSIAHVGIVRIH
jgi:hypothetical protein